MKINTLYNIHSKLSILCCLKSVAFLCAFLFVGFNGFGQTVTITANSDPEEGQITSSNNFTVNVVAIIAGSIDVNYTVLGTSTATEGVDFASLSGTVNIPLTLLGGSAPIQIDVIDDFIVEGNESVIIELQPDPGNYTLGGTTVASVDIIDNDIAGVSVDPISGLVTSEDGGTDSFDVVLTSEPTADVTIPLSSGYRCGL